LRFDDNIILKYQLIMKTLTYVFLFFLMLCACKKDINDGLTSLVNITDESPGENCLSGGYKIETGLDLNENSILDSDEVQNSVYLCNGTDIIDEISFGETQTEFSAEAVYQANSDGFLSVYYNASWSNTIDGYIFSDSAENPQTVVGRVGFVPGAITVPIKENNYWKVASVAATTVTISWIPIQ
jgi:hypothetical protein